MNYITEVKEFIVDNFLFGEEGDLDENTSFFNSDIIDSTGILELIAFLEEKYDIKVEDEEMLPENFNTLINISGYLEKKNKAMP
jgi:acyl carrier protein